MLTYIAAYDGTDASKAAVELAVRMARAERAQVIAAHVYPRIAVTVGRAALPEADKALQEDARLRGRAVLETLDVEGISRKELICGSPARELHELAVREHASLIAVGVTHHEHIGRLLPGSVGAKLLHGAPCAVVAVPAETSAGIGTIGVAYDGGEESQHALATAERLAQVLDARLELVGALAMPVYAEPALATEWDLQPAVRESFERDLREVADRVTSVPVDVRVVEGTTGRAIAAVSGSFDLLVTGSRGYGPARSVLLGGVSRYLVDHAHCPVLVVPRGMEAELDREVTPPAARAAW
jgi:nucleotide-binding universal stress UspA family protein